MKKKLLAGLLAACLMLSAVSCGGEGTETTTEQTPGTTASTSETTGTNTTATSETETTATTEATTGNTEVTPPAVETTAYDIESVKVGSFVTLQYNAASAEVTWEVKKGVGSRETVTLTATLRDDYLFDGWSEKDAIVNGQTAKSTELTYSFTASSELKVYCNTSMQVVYHANGGTALRDTEIDTFSAVFYQNPNTLPEQGYFAREGYLLTGYNTKADGSGEDVSLGSKVTGGKGKIEVYCIWEKYTDASAFETKSVRDGLAITAYTGTDETVVVPAEIDGQAVVCIAKGSFQKSTVTRVVLPSCVKTIENAAFENSQQLTTLVLFDTVTSINDRSFTGCKALTTMRINATTELVNEWYACGSAKIDRLIWAKDKKKIIIIGGSGSLYGYDCSVIDEALNGEYEIINFGENANISALVYFDLIEDFVGEGDIVLWCPEPGSYTLGATSCSSRFWEFRNSDYDFTKYIDLRNYDNFFSSFASYANALAYKKYRAYDSLSSSMTPYGDAMSDRTWNGNLFSYSFNQQLPAEFELADLFESIASKGASIFFSFAAMQESGIENVSEKDLARYESMILSLGNITSISDYQNCIYQDDMFWDSAWHLTDEGATERSKHVAEDLKKALGIGE